MKSFELRNKFIKFFKERDHKEVGSSSLIPENDPTVLFTTAGMHPLVPYLLGEKHPVGSRLVNCQRCIRTGDIELVGDDVHLTFFEMLGNWSLGDYFKQDAIGYSFEFLTSPKWLNFPLEKMAVSVFSGDKFAPFDEESFREWLSLGIPEERIAKLGKKDNWWGPAGKTGPCGPDTEMFFWTGEGPAPQEFDPKNSNWVEIWNDVFMQYNKSESSGFEPLTQCNVDTGMGVERVTAILQGKKCVYDTDIFIPLFSKLHELSNSTSHQNSRSSRLVVEHLRAATFLLMDGVIPSNVDQGYVLRRLIRRAIREAKKVGISNAFARKMAEVVIKQNAGVYPAIIKNKESICSELEEEENQFSKTLEKGLREFNKLIESISRDSKRHSLNGQEVFNLYETYGFPFEVTKDLAKENGFSVDDDGFNMAYKRHQEMSRKGSEVKFKGGLADHSDKTTRLHTATHLLHKALRMVLGDHVAQKGSNITAERLRFDFSHSQKMSKEDLAQVESIVNQEISKELIVVREEMTVDEAKNNGAIGLFEERYGEQVSVYSIGDFSKEICGGPHIENTNELGEFKISKEESSGRGVRRIKAKLI